MNPRARARRAPEPAARACSLASESRVSASSVLPESRGGPEVRERSSDEGIARAGAPPLCREESRAVMKSTAAYARDPALANNWPARSDRAAERSSRAPTSSRRCSARSRCRATDSSTSGWSASSSIIQSARRSCISASQLAGNGRGLKTARARAHRDRRPRPPAAGDPSSRASRSRSRLRRGSPRSEARAPRCNRRPSTDARSRI